MEQSLPEILSDPKANNFFRKRHTNTVSFAVGILLFLLPFAELTCGSTKLIGNTGIGIAFGAPWKTALGASTNEYLNKLRNPTDKPTKEMLREGPNVFAILALVFAAAGIGICFSYHRTRSMVAMSAGILAALMLIALLIQFKIAMKSVLSGNEEIKNFNIGMVLKLKFTIWYFLSLSCFVSAAFLSYKHSRIELDDALEKAVDFEFQHKV